MRLLIAGQLAVIVVAGLFAAARVDVFSARGFGDEPAHFDYVRMVAQQHRLPVLERDKTSAPVAALRRGRDPDTADQVQRPTGLAAEQYEAFQPPLYYLVAAPVFALSTDWFRRVRLVRALGLVFVLVAAALLYDLARRATGGAHLIAFSAALSVLMWPGVLVMSVTVSNASLELFAVSALVYVLWRADFERDARWLILSGVVLGLGILTKFTVVALAPLVVVVAARHVAEAPSRRRWAAAAAACLIPLVLLAPWMAYNLDHYNAVTPNGLAREMQQPVVNPEGTEFGLGRFWTGVPRLLSGFYPLEWTLGGLAEPALLGLLFDFVKAAFFGLPLLLLIVAPELVENQIVPAAGRAGRPRRRDDRLRHRRPRLADHAAALPLSSAPADGALRRDELVAATPVPTRTERDRSDLGTGLRGRVGRRAWSLLGRLDVGLP